MSVRRYVDWMIGLNVINERECTRVFFLADNNARLRIFPAFSPHFEILLLPWSPPPNLVSALKRSSGTIQGTTTDDSTTCPPEKLSSSRRVGGVASLTIDPSNGEAKELRGFEDRSTRGGACQPSRAMSTVSV